MSPTCRRFTHFRSGLLALLLVWTTVQANSDQHVQTTREQNGGAMASTSALLAVAVAESDQMPPTVSITGPNNGTTVALVTVVTARASDNVAVAGVQFALDGVSLGPEDTAAPYTVAWDTAAVANGAHTLTARARDAAGNATTSAPIAVTVSNDGSKPLTIDGAQLFQTMDGFGVNANSLSWKGGELKPALDLLIEQLGTTLWRVVFDMEDWETPNDNSDPAVPDSTYYNTLYSNAKFQNLWGILGYLNGRGAGANVVLSFMGKVPTWMGGSQINSTAEDEWVETITSLISYARNAKGIRFGMLDPLNEPDWDGVEGPKVDPTQYTRLLHGLAQKLDGLGFGDIRLVGPNTASIDTGTDSYMSAMMTDGVVMKKVDHLAFHNYVGYAANADSKIKSSGYPNKNFWITEVTNPWDIMTHLGQGPSGVMVWDAYDSVYNHAVVAGRGSTPPNDAGNGPAPLSYDTTTRMYTPRKSLYEDAQIFRFVPPGSVRIGAIQQTAGVVLYAFWHQRSGRLTIVARNSGGRSVVFEGTIKNLPGMGPFHSYQTSEPDASINFRQGSDVVVTGNTFSYTVPAYSWVTLTAASSPPRR